MDVPLPLSGFDVSEIVRQKALLRDGGDRWLRSLPQLVSELEADWAIVVGAALSGGSESVVLAATTAEGVAAIVKLELPGAESFAARTRVLDAADGVGYARLLRSDEVRRVLLLERLGPPLSESGLPIAAQIEILCRMLQDAWQVQIPVALETGAAKARRLAAFIETTWEELGRPCSERAVEQALRFAGSRASAFDPQDSVVVHGDAHAANALRAAHEYKFVDLESFFAERAYDLGISMRDWSDALLAGDTLQLGRERCALLARLAGVASEPIWEWGFLERVSTGLLGLQVGAEWIGVPTLAVADLWAG